jgi:hypothetical protein
MAELGDLSGIVFNVQTGNLVCGHQRRSQLPPDTLLTAHREATDDTGTVGYAEAHAHGTVWPVRLVDWPEAKALAACLAANNAAIQGEFTHDVGPALDRLAVDLPDMSEQLLLPDIDIPAIPEAPEEFPEYDDDIPTDYRCPKCGYEWSGKQE